VPDSRRLERAQGDARGLSSGELEAFRMLRTNLRYFNVGHDVRSILITSASPGDGKSTVAFNLAVAAATIGERVLLVEADLRNPSLARFLDGRPSVGLAEVLAGYSTVHDALMRVPYASSLEPDATIDVLPAGSTPPNPGELIDSTPMRELLESVEAEYDFVVVDTPPASVVSDAIPLVTKVDGVVVVTRLGKNTRDALVSLRDQLRNLKAPTLGVVVNAVEADQTSYYGYGYGAEPSKREPAKT